MKTITYSKAAGLDIKLDLYIPTPVSSGPKAALVFFHGGGMVTGGRRTLYFQRWLIGTISIHPTIQLTLHDDEFQMRHSRMTFSSSARIID